MSIQSDRVRTIADYNLYMEGFYTQALVLDRFADQYDSLVRVLRDLKRANVQLWETPEFQAAHTLLKALEL